jgi:hypothetical protein
MKKLFLSVLVALVSLCAFAQTVDSLKTADLASEVKVDKHQLNLYGFARSEMYVNSRENYEAKGGVISLYPKPNTGFSP